MAGHLVLDSEVDLSAVETEMVAADDFLLARAFRRQARVRSATEFKEHIDKIAKEVAVDPLEAAEADPALQLPHRGALVR